MHKDKFKVIFGWIDSHCFVSTNVGMCRNDKSISLHYLHQRSHRFWINVIYIESGSIPYVPWQFVTTGCESYFATHFSYHFLRASKIAPNQRQKERGRECGWPKKESFLVLLHWRTVTTSTIIICDIKVSSTQNLKMTEGRKKIPLCLLLYPWSYPHLFFSLSFPFNLWFQRQRKQETRNPSANPEVDWLECRCSSEVAQTSSRQAWGYKEGWLGWRPSYRIQGYCCWRDCRGHWTPGFWQVDSWRTNIYWCRATSCPTTEGIRHCHCCSIPKPPIPLPSTC